MARLLATRLLTPWYCFSQGLASSVPVISLDSHIKQGPPCYSFLVRLISKLSFYSGEQSVFEDEVEKHYKGWFTEMEKNCAKNCRTVFQTNLTQRIRYSTRNRQTPRKVCATKSYFERNENLNTSIIVKRLHW